MEHQLATKSTQKQQPKEPASSSSLQQESLNRTMTHPVLRLQRAVGNQAVQRMVREGGVGLQNRGHESGRQALTSLALPVLQRKCACGGAPGPDGECAACRSKRLAMQSRSSFVGTKVHTNRTALIEPEFISQPGDRYEREADQAAEQVMHTSSEHAIQGRSGAIRLSRAMPLIQRAIADETAESAGGDTEPASETAPETPEATEADTTSAASATSGTPPASGLIVEDNVEEVGPGQMHKSEFLNQLQAALSDVVSAESAGTVNNQVDFYSSQSSQRLETDIHTYVPETADATTASDYIPAITDRVGQYIDGNIPVGAGIASFVSSLIGSASSLVSSIFFKGHAGGPQAATNPQAIQAKLGSGRSLDSGTKSRMESTFGQDFSHVRIHTDAGASALSAGLNARAFTIGEDVAFGSGEYQPGTLIGDALIAHELAHVIQQGSADQAIAPLQVGEAGYNALEEDADVSAVGAVASLWGGAKGVLKDIARNTIPQLRSGLRLSSCKKTTTLTGALGKWSLSQDNTDGSSTSDYVSDAKIKYTPEATKVNCDEIAFVQNVRFIDAATKTSKEPRSNFLNRITASGWTIDRLDQKKYGWYGYNNDGKPSGTVTPGKSPKPLTPAEMSDNPHWNVPSLIWDFETCAICKGGTDVSKQYGCLTWGFDVDASNNLKSHTPTNLNSPSAEFAEAVKQWNVQTAGPAANRNDPDQQPLGPFK